MMLCACGFHRWSSKATCRKCTEHTVRFINRLSAYQRNNEGGVLNIMGIKKVMRAGLPKSRFTACKSLRHRLVVTEDMLLKILTCIAGKCQGNTCREEMSRWQIRIRTNSRPDTPPNMNPRTTRPGSYSQKQTNHPLKP